MQQEKRKQKGEGQLRLAKSGPLCTEDMWFVSAHRGKRVMPLRGSQGEDASTPIDQNPRWDGFTGGKQCRKGAGGSK